MNKNSDALDLVYLDGTSLPSYHGRNPDGTAKPANDAAERLADRRSFYASVRAIAALCSMCKQPQSAPSCERREHWGA